MQGAEDKTIATTDLPASCIPHPAPISRINRIVAVLHTRNVRAQVRFLVDALSAQTVAPKCCLTI